MFFDTAASGTSSLQTFQYRIGGRYFPAAPVQTSTNIGSSISNGGCEAYVELSKALNIVGDYRLSTGCNTQRWGLQNAGGTLQESDYEAAFGGVAANGVPSFIAIGGGGNSFCGGLGSQCFAMATDLETSNGVEISGLNAEEQSDIALIANWKNPQVTGSLGTPSSLEVYSYYDAMIVLRENNVSYPRYFLIFFRSLNLFNKVCGLANKINMSNERDGNNFGLNDSLKYYEFELDSLDNSGGYSAGSSATDWPIFLIGGKSPLYNIAAIKIIEVQIPFTW